MTPAEFIAAYPDPAFASLDAGASGPIQKAIDRSLKWVSLDVWADFYDEGVGLVAAHYLTVDALVQAGTAGVANDDTYTMVGSVTTMRNPSLVAAQVADPFLATGYGQRYRALARMLGHGGAVL